MPQTSTKPTKARQSAGRRLLAVAVGLVVASVGLELVLQAAAWVTWRGQEKSISDGQRMGRVVLCIGDSLTFGLCAPPASAYPVRLQEMLGARGVAATVVNAGIPGQNSADILQRLPELLAKLRPDVVCLLFGWNDTWSRPARLNRDQIRRGTAFPLRWRTKRLIAWATSEDAGVDHDATQPFLGVWHLGDFTIHLRPDGSVTVNGQHMRWQAQDDVLNITPSDGKTFPVRWRVTDRALEFALFGWNKFQRARPGPPSSTPAAEEVGDMVERGDFQGAEDALDRATTDAVAIRAVIADALLRAGRGEDAAKHIAALELAWNEVREPVAGESLAFSLAYAGKRDQARIVASSVVGLDPTRIGAWRVLVDGSPPEERAALLRQLAASEASAEHTWQKASLVMERAILVSTTDAQGAMTLVLQARQLGIGSDETIAGLARAVALGADRQALIESAQAAALPDKGRAALCSDVRRAVVEDAEVFQILDDHLRMAVELCQASGAKVVLPGYPFSMPKHEEILQRVARDSKAVLVPTQPAFTAKLQTEPRDAWFADAIHCTDSGYALMARLIVDAVATR